MYKEVFLMGLPMADFEWALLWKCQSPPKPHTGFPTWSWAGWKVGIWPTYPSDLTEPNQYQIRLSIWRAVEGQLMQILKTSQGNLKDTDEHCAIVHDDPIARAAKEDLQFPDFEVDKHPTAEADVYLFTEVIVLLFNPDFNKPLLGIRQHGSYELFRFLVRGFECGIQIISTDAEIRRSAGVTRQFILLARDIHKGYIYHHLLLVHTHVSVSFRGTALALMVPLHHAGVLDELGPKMERIVLA